MVRHNFTVAAVDGVGNIDPTPALLTWTVDTTALDTIIDSAIDGNGNPVLMVILLHLTLSLLHFQESKRRCRPLCMDQNWRWGLSIHVPVLKHLVDLADGSDNFTVAAVDGVGNKDPTPASFTWTVDTTAPDTTIDSAIDGNNNPVVMVILLHLTLSLLHFQVIQAKM